MLEAECLPPTVIFQLSASCDLPYSHAPRLNMLSRKDFLKSVVIAAAGAAMPVRALSQQPAPDITIADLKAFEKLTGLTFTDTELKEVLSDAKDWLKGYESIRKLPLEQFDPPTIFVPKSNRPVEEGMGVSVKTTGVGRLKRPASNEDLAFMSVRELSQLVKSKQVTSLELTELAISRLSTYGDKLLCLVKLLSDDARAHARQMDAELKAGRSRGPLHGIPCGLKDLFAFQGAPTTWGADPYKTQSFPYNAAIVDKLHEAGAVVVAKLSMGALAQGDVWFKGKTKNPWNPKEGSSGSSAGSASATAAGLVPFAIGTETLGSIVSPSHVCRVTGFRPTFGRVSRYGAMELCYSMDKVGPICRQVEDCAMVFAAITGGDSRDRSSVDRPFHFQPDINLRGVNVGFVVGPKEDPKERLQKDDYLKILNKMGARLEPVTFTPPAEGALVVLEVEAASAFDQFTREGKIHELKNSSWPESFRASRLVPGVEYLQAMRARSLLMDQFERELGHLDVVVAPDRGGVLLRITNLTGHPQVLVPFGTDDKGNSRSVSFVGRIYEESTLLTVASKFQLGMPDYELRADLSYV